MTRMAVTAASVDRIIKAITLKQAWNWFIVSRIADEGPTHNVETSYDACRTAALAGEPRAVAQWAAWMQVWAVQRLTQ